MKNTFAEDFAKLCQIKNRYLEAKAANDEAEMAAARAALKVLDDSIDAMGQTYRGLYRLYESAQERGNEHLDLEQCYDYRDEAALIASFREYGIETFTFSSRYSSAVESAWMFIQNGCTLKGIVEINSKTKKWEGDGYEKCPAYLFSVN